MQKASPSWGALASPRNMETNVWSVARELKGGLRGLVLGLECGAGLYDATQATCWGFDAVGWTQFVSVALL